MFLFSFSLAASKTRCHATPKMNFFHPKNICFAILKVAICAIFVTSCTILHIAGDKLYTCIRLLLPVLSEKYFLLCES